MAARLRTKKAASHRDDAPVFATIAGTELNRANVASRILKPAGKAAGVPWASFHTFRHMCASILFEEGRNVKQVAEWLGHADPAFTLRTYVHLLDDGVGSAAFFDFVLGKETGAPQGADPVSQIALKAGRANPCQTPDR
jgi:integrase